MINRFRNKIYGACKNTIQAEKTLRDAQFFFLIQAQSTVKYKQLKWPEVVRSSLESNEKNWGVGFMEDEQLLSGKYGMAYSKEERRQK